MGLKAFSAKRNRFVIYSLTAGLLGIFFFYLIGKAGIYSEFRGLYQRLFLTNFFGWLVVTGNFFYSPKTKK